MFLGDAPGVGALNNSLAGAASLNDVFFGDPVEMQPGVEAWGRGGAGAEGAAVERAVQMTGKGDSNNGF